MANNEHLDRLKHARLRQDVKEWNEWRKNNPEICPDLSGADLSKMFLSGVNFSGAKLWRANLSEADLSSSNLSNADLSQANLRDASLIRANIQGASFRGSLLSGASFAGTKGAAHAKRLENTRLCPQEDVDGFERCHREWPERWFDWERFRVIGRLPLFGLSYTAFIFISIFFYTLDFYNEKVELTLNLIQTICPADSAQQEAAGAAPDSPADFTRKGCTFLLSHLRKQPIPNQSLLLFTSTVFLGIASTLYTFFCPSRIKEFSRDQWCD